MIKVFRWALWLYYGVAFTFFGIVVVVGGICFASEPRVTVILCLLGIIPIIIICVWINNIAQKYYIKLNNILNNQCDAQLHLEKLLAKTTKHPIALFDISSAYSFVGDDKQVLVYAEHAKRKIGKIHKNIRWAYEVLYYNLLFSVALFSNDLPQAASCIKKIQSIEIKKGGRAVTLTLRFRLRIAEGNYDGAEAFFLICMEDTSHLLDRVKYSYILGDLYIKLGMHEKAREYLEFVIQNGNMTRYVALAHTLLQIKDTN
jgi:hypothetical protein